MRWNHFTVVLIIAAAGLLTTVRAQSPVGLSQLREEINTLEAIDRDAGTQPEIRSFNRTLLDERRNRLRSLLQDRIAALQTYRRLVSLTPDERASLDDAIRTVEKELAGDKSAVEGTSTASTTNHLALAPTPTPTPRKSKEGGGASEVSTIRLSVSEVIPAALQNDADRIKDNFSDLADLTEQDLKSFDDAMRILINTKEPSPKSDDYCIVHVVAWTAKKADQDAWFLYAYSGKDWVRQKDYDGKRIYGSKRVAVLLLHFEVPGGVKDISYKIAVNKKVPAPILHLTALLGDVLAVADASKRNLWAEKMIIVENVPSDILVTGTMGFPGEQSQQLSRTYDNEGRYYWDVSLGVPVKTIREVQFVSEGNKLTTAGKERQDVYGFLNIYPVKVDVSGKDLATFPHFMVGVPLASKPLHHPFAGMGYGIYKGPIKFNIFAGVVFDRERVPRTLSEGSTATAAQVEADLKTRWVRKFTWGFSFPVSQIKDAIKK